MIVPFLVHESLICSWINCFICLISSFSVKHFSKQSLKETRVTLKISKKNFSRILDRPVDTEQLQSFHHSLLAKRVQTLILWDCKITYNESRLLQIPKLFWLKIFELKISETAVIPVLFKLLNLFIALYESVLLSCFHTTQEVSSWSTIVCIPVSPVAIYPVFKVERLRKALLFM